MENIGGSWPAPATAAIVIIFGLSFSSTQVTRTTGFGETKPMMDLLMGGLNFGFAIAAVPPCNSLRALSLIVFAPVLL
jgi:hypothetical protein